MARPTHRAAITGGSRSIDGYSCTDKSLSQSKPSTTEQQSRPRFLQILLKADPATGISKQQSHTFLVWPLMSFSAAAPNSSLNTRNRSRLIVPFAKCFALCTLCILLLVALLGSGRHTTPGSAARQRTRTTWDEVQKSASRRFQTDLSAGGAGFSYLKTIKGCREDMVDYVPCYHAGGSRTKAGLKAGEQFDRDCESTRLLRQCMVRPPKGYRSPKRWPACRDNVWNSNIRGLGPQEHHNPGPARILSPEDGLISFLPSSAQQEYIDKLESWIALGTNRSLNQMGVRVVLDIVSDYGDFSSAALSSQLLTMSISKYQEHGSPVQIALERGLPAMISSFSTRQLPYPFAAFDLIHCKDCGVQWLERDGVHLFESNRLLRPGGYFVLTLSRMGQSIESLTEMYLPLTTKLCWNVVAQEDQTTIWQKTVKQNCRRSAMCNDEKQDADLPWEQTTKPCIIPNPRSRWHPVQKQHRWPNRLTLTSRRLTRYGRSSSKNFTEDTQAWSARIANYWSLFNPVLFSDHPKRPADDDPTTPANVVRNVMDMNAGYAGFNAALLATGKDVWVMNVVPTSSDNTLPVVYDRGLLGTVHDWCQAFPSYPRTYDLLYAASLLSQELRRAAGSCTPASLLLEMDRLLRPEGWLLLEDEAQVVEAARRLLIQMRWEARVIEIRGHAALRLLVGQKRR